MPLMMLENIVSPGFVIHKCMQNKSATSVIRELSCTFRFPLSASIDLWTMVVYFLKGTSDHFIFAQREVGFKRLKTAQIPRTA